jgi:hypothetical protein
MPRGPQRKTGRSAETERAKHPVGRLGRTRERAGEDLRVGDEKSLFATHRRASKVREGDEIRRVHRATIRQHDAFGDIRRVHSVEEQHSIDAREVARLAKNRAHGSMSGGETNQRKSADPLDAARRGGNLARYAAEQRIERGWISKRAIVRAGSGAEIHDRSYRPIAKLCDGLLGDPRDSVKVDHEVDLVAFSYTIRNKNFDWLARRTRERACGSGKRLLDESLMRARLLDHRRRDFAPRRGAALDLCDRATR